MVVAGQPKTHRRVHPGDQPRRPAPSRAWSARSSTGPGPRDLSHYERFEHYHATFYQHVEALSVTPFAPAGPRPGPDRPAGVAGAATGDGVQRQPAARAGFDRQPRQLADQSSRFLKRRSDGRPATTPSDTGRGELRPGSTSGARRPAAGRRDAGLRRSAGRATTSRACCTGPAEGPLGLFTCLNSLRDVEPGVQLMLATAGPTRRRTGRRQRPAAGTPEDRRRRGES